MLDIGTHLSNIELQKSKIGLAWDPVEAKDAIHHMSPNLDQTIWDTLAHICKPGTCASELSPDHIHHVILIIILLESNVFILRNDKKNYEQIYRACAQTFLFQNW